MIRLTQLLDQRRMSDAEMRKINAAQVEKELATIAATPVALYVAIGKRPGDESYQTAWSQSERDQTIDNLRQGRWNFLDVACDQCGTRLASNLIISFNPKRELGCPGCGWRGVGPLDLPLMSVNA